MRINPSQHTIADQHSAAFWAAAAGPGPIRRSKHRSAYEEAPLAESELEEEEEALPVCHTETQVESPGPAVVVRRCHM